MSDDTLMRQGLQVSKQEQNWAMLCHLSALSGFLFPFGNLIGPLVVWLLKRAEMPQVEHHGKESLNFQISVTIAALICIPLMFVLIGFALIFVVAIGALVLTVMATVKVSNGDFGYRYPFTLRLLK